MKNMILSTAVFVLFASLATAHAGPETDLVELKNSVLVNMPVLRQAIDAFQSAGYYTMGNQSEFVLARMSDRKYKIDQFPTDVPIADLTLDQYRTYRIMLGFSLRFSLYSNASRLSDELKARALTAAADKSARHDYSTPNSMQIRQMVLETIRQETGLLGEDGFVKPDQKLENFYADLDKFAADFAGHSITSDVAMNMVKMIQDHCSQPSSGCSFRLGHSVETFLNVHKRIKENTPIDDIERINNLLFDVLPDYLKAYKVVGDALEADHLLCLFRTDGCKKWPENY